MKEKISWSLDGKTICKIDAMLSTFPFIQNRSAVIEMAIINLHDDLVIENPELGLTQMVGLYGRRCDLDAQKESKD